MFNMEVSKHDDPLKLLEQYRLSWVCDGNKVTCSFVITKEMIWAASDANEVIAQAFTHYMDAAVLDRHGDTKCEWCTSAQYSLQVVIKNTNAGMTVPKPFWKPKSLTLQSGQVFIGKTGGPDTEWQELGYISVDGIQFGPKYHSGGSIEAENGTFGSLTGDALSVSETMKKMQQQIHYTSQMTGGWNHPNNPAADIYAETAAQREARMLEQRSNELPGVNTWVKYPCECGGQGRIRGIIMHLNDAHRWTREAIADWLDSVDCPENGIDLAFKVPEKEEE